MYWFAETRAAHLAFWRLVRDGLRKHGIAAPDDLDETASPHDLWSAPDLVLSHICNLPYRQAYRDRLTRIAASDYGLEGCAPGHYRALFIVHENHAAQSPEDLAGATMAYNSADSHSGWGAAGTWAMARGIRYRPAVETGSHRRSLAAVAERRADFATIDAQSFENLVRIDPAAKAVRVIGATDPSPGMTFVTRSGEDPTLYLAALRAAIEGLEDRHRQMLGLRDVVVLPDEAYDIPLPPDLRDWRD